MASSCLSLRLNGKYGNSTTTVCSICDFYVSKPTQKSAVRSLSRRNHVPSVYPLAASLLRHGSRLRYRQHRAEYERYRLERAEGRKEFQRLRSRPEFDYRLRGQRAGSATQTS